MATDEDKCKIAKLLQGLDVPEVKLTERCNDLVREFHKKFDSDANIEDLETEAYENPYIPDRELIGENDKKLKELLADSKRDKKAIDLNLDAADPKRPWRTNSNKEKLLRIENELKQHIEKSITTTAPMDEQQMKELVKHCREETSSFPPVNPNRLRETVDEAKRNLPNFQYRIIENSTATTILPQAHASVKAKEELQSSVDQ
ncbi:uncharacterized protein LOC112047821 [Bicyclus anynana]|uniref:Uncharacterized protein LOC112047821 n=1 Tax=Bicyclus anynana TaxID=110368 RepID=A0A6J1N1V0_BICAN|nr:uncharacterized protein LOC112047821 [Bicyclus anynana]